MALVSRQLATDIDKTRPKPAINRSTRADSKSIKPLAQRQKAMLEKKEADIKKQQELKKEQEDKECR